MTTSHESICCSEVNTVIEKKEEGSSTVSCIMTTKVFIACVWTFGCCKQPTSNYQQHYGVAEEKAIHE